MAGSFTLNLNRNPSTNKLQSGYGEYIAGVTPSITSHSGSFTQDSTFRIDGNNFSANRQTQLFYDDFTAGTLGQAISATGTGWVTVPTMASYVYSSDGLAAGKRSAYLDMQGAYDYITGLTFPNTDEIYCEHWIKYQMLVVGPDDGSGSPQMKLTRIGSGTDFTTPSSNPNLTVTMLDVNAGGYIGTSPQVFNAPAKSTNDAAQSVSGYISLPPDGSWHKLHMAAKISTLGQSDGWRYFKTDQIGNNVHGYSGDAATASWTAGTEKHFASPNALVPKTSWDGEPWSTRYSADGNTVNGYFGKVVLPFFTRTYQVSDVKVACFWLNDTAERVVVSTSNDVNTALKTGVIQPNISRTNAQWVFQGETGNLPASGALYAYVVNANRKISNPIQIRA